MPFPLNDLWEVPEPAIVPAVWFLDRGIGVFPLKTRSKEPACSSWDNYTCTREQASRFVNYGVRLNAALGVLDTDNPETENWVLQQIATGAIPETPFVVATARGAHRYFRLAGPLAKFIHRSGHTIEFRNVGQYVVGPGSVHPSGTIYTASKWSWRWEDISFFPSDFSFDDRPLTARGSPPGGEYEFPEAVHAGERHDQLFRLLRSFKASSVDYDVTRKIVLLANDHRCHPRLVVDDAFDRWFNRAWNQRDRPFPEAPSTTAGYDTRILRRLGLRL